MANDEIATLKHERDNWKGLALYLADCHAATTQTFGDLKSTSESGKKRLVLICEEAAWAIHYAETGPVWAYWGNRIRAAKDIMQRCLDAAAEMRKK